jgi:S-methylmethionine-dependent homocysteine/selenocysteine methylase
MGHLLKQQGVLSPDDDFLAVATRPAALQAVGAAARAYASAGCTVLTAPNFGVVPVKLRKAGQDDEELEALTAACVAAVRVEGAAPETRIAGGLPPLGPDCYAPAPPAIAATARAVHARIAGVLLDSGVDLFLAETVSSSDDAAALVAGAADAVVGAAGGGGGDGGGTAPFPVWVAWTLADGVWPPRLRGGELLADAAVALAAAARRSEPAVAVTAQLVNCSDPGSTTAGVAVLRNALPPGVEVGAFANGFATTTSEWLSGGRGGGGGGGGGGEAQAPPPPSTSSSPPPPAAYGSDGMITPSAYAALAKEWVAAGATIVGGCCGVGPAHMAAVADAVRR